MLNVYDFEMVARVSMKKEGWDYYSSGADDEITLRENHAAYQRVWLRPRVLVNVTDIDMTYGASVEATETGKNGKGKQNRVDFVRLESIDRPCWAPGLPFHCTLRRLHWANWRIPKERHTHVDRNGHWRTGELALAD
jgi:hypothetical protein